MGELTLFSCPSAASGLGHLVILHSRRQSAAAATAELQVASLPRNFEASLVESCSALRADSPVSIVNGWATAVQTLHQRLPAFSVRICLEIMCLAS